MPAYRRKAGELKRDKNKKPAHYGAVAEMVDAINNLISY